MKSVEETIEDLVKDKLNSLKIPFYRKTDSVNEEIDKALNEGVSKQKNFGGNRPDIKLLINEIPIMVEVKGNFNKLEKINIYTQSLSMEFNDIANYALNGAVHYANTIVGNSLYNSCIALGITGTKVNDKVNIIMGAYKIVRDEPIEKLRGFNFLEDLGKLNEIR